ncbi:retrotransposon hot spot (RHS) protein, partial [Trypanosoma conorhini]
MQLVGPLPRDIFSAAAFDGRTAAGDGAVRATDAPVAEDDCAREGEKLWGAGNPFRRPVKIERECGAHGVEALRYTNVCCFFDPRMGARLCGVLGPSECLSRLRRAARLPEELQKPRA